MSNEMKSLFSGKIAIATDDQKRVTGHIGRCKGFVVYEINDGKILNKEVRENHFTKHRRRWEASSTRRMEKARTRSRQT